MVNYKVSEDAKIDLICIHQYGVRNFGEDRADKYYMDFFERFEQIAENPYLYKAVDHIREGYRCSPCGVDSIYYCILDETIEIMNVLGRQDIEEAL